MVWTPMFPHLILDVQVIDLSELVSTFNPIRTMIYWLLTPPQSLPDLTPQCIIFLGCLDRGLAAIRAMYPSATG